MDEQWFCYKLELKETSQEAPGIFWTEKHGQSSTTKVTWRPRATAKSLRKKFPRVSLLQLHICERGLDRTTGLTTLCAHFCFLSGASISRFSLVLSKGRCWNDCPSTSKPSPKAHPWAAAPASACLRTQRTGLVEKVLTAQLVKANPTHLGYLYLDLMSSGEGLSLPWTQRSQTRKSEHIRLWNVWFWFKKKIKPPLKVSEQLARLSF